jgi:hypothetical protein
MDLALLSLSFAAAGNGPSRHSIEAYQPGPDEVSLTELGWMVKEVAPMVEEASGRDFVVLPEVVHASRDQLADVVYQEQLHLLRDVDGLSEEEAERSARRTAIEMSGAFAGKYGFLDGRLYVSVEGISDSLALEGAPQWMLRPMIRLVIAHELTHALQDQHSDLETLVAAAPSGDAIMAINCAVEGHAVWVHEQVAERTNNHGTSVVLSRMLGYDQPARKRMNPDHFYHTYVYGLGREFVAWHHEQGGNERVWQVLAAPPLATSMIVDPGSWGAQVGRVDPTVQRVLRRASERLAGKGWQPTDEAMGDYDVRDQLVRAGADSELADGLALGWNSRLVGGAMAGVEVQLLEFESPVSASAFVDALREQAEAQAERVGVDLFISADAGAFDLVRGDSSAREAITVTLLGEELEDHLGRIWVARGNVVVQVVLVNAPANERQVAASIDRVFRAVGTR